MVEVAEFLLHFKNFKCQNFYNNKVWDNRNEKFILGLTLSTSLVWDYKDAELLSTLKCKVIWARTMFFGLKKALMCAKRRWNIFSEKSLA